MGVINTHDPNGGYTGPSSEEERGYHFFLNTPLNGPDISQEGAMGCVQAAVACTINDDHILKHAYSHFPTI